MAGTPVYKSATTNLCSDCGYDLPLTRSICPHCGRPSLFPNVNLASVRAEVQKLNVRHQEAENECRQKNCTSVGADFENACSQAVAIFNCPLQKLVREIATGTELFETYYDLQRLRLQSAVTGKYDWNKLRPQAEIELLGSEEHIYKLHYACLSLDGSGLHSYGDCTVQLDDRMIAHRATCFEGNTAIVFAKVHDFSGFLRCDWPQRHKICFALGARLIDSNTKKADFPRFVVEVGAMPEDDRFIEVHIFGPMTSKTFKSVRIDAAKHSRREKLLREAIAQKLGGVHFEVINS